MEGTYAEEQYVCKIREIGPYGTAVHFARLFLVRKKRYDMGGAHSGGIVVDRTEFSACFKVLEDTIAKKEKYLEEVLALTKGQEEVLLHEKFSMDAFTALMDKKEPYIQKISEFDAGFEAVFAKIKPVMEQYKKEFEPRIRGMQDKIKSVLEKGAALCTLEEQNKTRLEFCLKDKNSLGPLR